MSLNFCRFKARGGGLTEKEEKEEKEEEKIPHMCESIGHRPLRGRCPKGGTTDKEGQTEVKSGQTNTRKRAKKRIEMKQKSRDRTHLTGQLEETREPNELE